MGQDEAHAWARAESEGQKAGLGAASGHLGPHTDDPRGESARKHAGGCRLGRRLQNA
jgi:hypothetical protein